MSAPNLNPHSYHWCQVVLHWLVALLVVVQYSTGGSIGRTHDAVAQGLQPEPLDLTLHAIHNRVGLGIFGLMIARLAMRFLVGIPSPPVPKSDWRFRLARATHLGFYLILLTQAATGVIASYFFWPVSAVHVALSKALLALIVLHVLGAFWHFFIARDGVMERMWDISGFRNRCSQTFRAARERR